MLNLAPPEIKKRKGVKSLVYSLVTVYIVIGVLVLLGAAGLASANLVAKANLASKQTTLDGLKAEQNKSSDLAVKLGFIDNRVSSAAKYQNSNDWNSVLEAIAASTPEGVTLTSVKLAATTAASPTVEISANTKDRRLAILFKDKLAVTKPFTDARLTGLNEVDGPSGKVFTFTLVTALTKTR